MTNTNPYRERQWYNIGKGALISLILAFILPIPFILSLLEMKVYSAIVIYSATWLVLVSMIIYFVRISRPNAYHFVDKKIIKKTVNDLHNNRITNKKTFITTELAELQKGKKIPVLDIWKNDPHLTSQHSFFSRIAHFVIDPPKKEAELLIQLPAFTSTNTDKAHISRLQLYFRIAEFLKIAAGDPQFSPYQDFFSTLIVECDVLREDENGYDVPISVFSMELPAEQFWKLSTLPLYQEVALERIANVRFSDGAAVEPHRIMRM